MPRRFIFSTNEINNLLSIPDTQDDLIRHYTFSKNDLSIIRQHRGDSKRLGFAIQLCYMRYPGIFLGINEAPPSHLLRFVAEQLKISPDEWNEYGNREQTRREHLVELQSIFGFKPFTVSQRQAAVNSIFEIAKQTDKGIVLAATLIRNWRNKSILLPTTKVIKDLCAQAITRASRDIYQGLTEPLAQEHLEKLDGLLKLKPFTKLSTMVWLRQSPGAPNAKHILEHIDRLRVLRSLELPEGIEKNIQQNHLLKMAREGAKMTPKDLADFETKRRYATLAAIAIETEGTLTDEIIELNDRILGAMFNRARRNHDEQSKEFGKINKDLIRLYYLFGKAYFEGNESERFKTIIERVIPWEQYIQSVKDAEILMLSEGHDYLYRIIESYSQIRRYSPAFLKF